MGYGEEDEALAYCLEIEGGACHNLKQIKPVVTMQSGKWKREQRILGG